MALNIKDQETEKLAAEVAELTGDSKAGAVREALREQRDRLELERGARRRSGEIYADSWKRSRFRMPWSVIRRRGRGAVAPPR